MLFQADRLDCLPQLAAPAPRRAIVESSQLHGDRRGPRYNLAAAQVIPKRPADCTRVDTAMLIETMVFDGDERRDHVGINLVQRCPSLPGPVSAPGASKHQPMPILQLNA